MTYDSDSDSISSHLATAIFQAPMLSSDKQLLNDVTDTDFSAIATQFIGFFFFFFFFCQDFFEASSSPSWKFLLSLWKSCHQRGFKKCQYTLWYRLVCGVSVVFIRQWLSYWLLLTWTFMCWHFDTAWNPFFCPLASLSASCCGVLCWQH